MVRSRRKGVPGQPGAPPRSNRTGPESPISRILCPRSAGSWSFLWDRRCRRPRATYPEAPPPRGREGDGRPLRHLPIWSCSAWGLPCLTPSPAERCALTAPFHPYPGMDPRALRAVCSLLHFPSRRRASPLASMLPVGVRTFLPVRRAAFRATTWNSPAHRFYQKHRSHPGHPRPAHPLSRRRHQPPPFFSAGSPPSRARPSNAWRSSGRRSRISR